MNYVEKWGNTEEEAVELALADLKLSKNEVIIEVLEESNKGFLGIGKKLAKVRVSKKNEAKPFETSKAQLKNEEKNIIENVPLKKEASKEKEKEEIPVITKDRENSNHREGRRPKNLTPIEETPALDFLKDVIDKMGIEVELSACSDNGGNVYIDINGKDSARVIGKRGQTLDALQYLTRVVVNRDEEEYTKIVVDAGEYRAKREKTLTLLAKRLADKAIRTKRPVKLEPMSPYERKVIHSTLQDNKRVNTRSEGEEPYRRVIIETK